MPERPTGTVTFLFSDVEGSTRLWEDHPAEMQLALKRHDEILRACIEDRGGYVFSTAGDAFAAAFSGCGEAVGAAIAAQAELGSEPWPVGVELRVRVGLHAGEAQERDGDYFGSVVNRAARIMSAGHGGQVLASAAVVELVDHADAVDLGEHRLKDLTEAQRLWQLGRGEFPSLRTLDATRTNLPVERTALVGRKAEIDNVADLLAENRLVTLLGIGGTGKTRLAAAVAAEIADLYGDGVWFVDLVTASDSDEVAETVASAMGLQVSGTDLVAGLAELLAERDLLVVLDNCEHITDDVADVVDVLLERTTGPRFLATSREPLQLLDERQIQVPPLEVAEDLAAPAVQLFVVASRRIGVRVSSEDVEVVAQICSQLDGLPLSIELAAAQLRQLTLAELAVRLEQRFELLARGRRRRGRQASLLAVLNDTWAMLDLLEADLLLQLAAFPASFSADDVEGVVAGQGIEVPTRSLSGLVDLGLVAGASDGRHRLLETVKLFARQQWAHAPDPEVYIEQHAGWVLGYLSSLAVQERYTSLEVAAWASSHYDDHRAVESRLAETGRASELALLLSSLSLTYTYTSGTRASAVIERVERYVEMLALSNYESGVLNLVAAGAGLPARRPDWIERGSTAAVTMLRSDGASVELAAALVVCSWMTAFHDIESAVAMLEEARSLADDAGAPEVADVALAYLAGHNGLGGRTEAPLRILDELHTRLVGRPLDYAGSLHDLFTVATRIVTDPETARAAGEAGVAGLRGISDEIGTGFGLQTVMCVAVAACGDVDATRQSLDKAKQLARTANNDDGLPDLLLAPAVLAHKTGDLDRARRFLTAIRYSPKPTQNFQMTIIYRQLRTQIGLDDNNPLESMTLDDIYAQAVDWIASL